MKNARKAPVIAIAIGVIILIVLVPVGIDALIFGSSLVSHISNSDWASFLGSYIGAIIGGFITLAGIWITIRFTRSENQLERRTQVAPYLNITYRTGSPPNDDSALFDYIYFSPYAGQDLNSFSCLILKNVGFGPLLNCCLTDVRYNDTLIPRAFKLVNANALQQGEEWILELGLGVREGTIPPEYIQDLDGQEVIASRAFSEASGKLTFYLCYNDIIDTPYQQKITVEVNMGAERAPGGPWVYAPSVRLTGVEKREIANDRLKYRRTPFPLKIDGTPTHE